MAIMVNPGFIIERLGRGDGNSGTGAGAGKWDWKAVCVGMAVEVEFRDALVGSDNASSVEA